MKTRHTLAHIHPLTFTRSRSNIAARKWCFVFGLWNFFTLRARFCERMMYGNAFIELETTWTRTQNSREYLHYTTRHRNRERLIYHPSMYSEHTYTKMNEILQYTRRLPWSNVMEKLDKHYLKHKIDFQRGFARPPACCRRRKKENVYSLNSLFSSLIRDVLIHTRNTNKIIRFSVPLHK